MLVLVRQNQEVTASSQEVISMQASVKPQHVIFTLWLGFTKETYNNITYNYELLQVLVSDYLLPLDRIKPVQWQQII